MRRQINNLISVGYSAIRLTVMKIFNHGIHISLVERISPNVVLEINRGGILNLGNKVRIHSGSKIKVRNRGMLTIGSDVKMNYGCMIFCHNKITIGEGTEFGPSVYVYDHDHEFNRENGVEADKFKYAPVFIGKNVWIGAGTIILRGTEIGDNCVIGAGSVVKGSYPEGTVIVQKREMTIRQ